MHHHHKTPLRVPILAILAALFAAFLFGGVSRAADEAQSSSGITTEAQSSSSTAAVANNTQSSSSAAVASTATTDNVNHCIPQDISPGEVDTLLQTQDGSVEFTAYEAVRFSITLTLEEGHCSGDSIVVSVPEELGTDGDDSPVPMTTPSGIVIGYATYNGTAHTVTVTLTDQVEVPGRRDFHASAWWTTHMESSLVPGETRELIWNLDGVIRRTVLRVGTCDGCSTVGADPSKWGSVDGERQHITIVLPTATQDGQQFTITDTLTSPGQSFICDQLLAGKMGVYTEAGPWGQPRYTKFLEPDIVSCSSDKATVNVKLDKGEKARFQVNILVDSTDPGPWSDSAVITSQDKSWEVKTQVTRRESGGNAGFDTTPAPTPTPTPVPTPSPEPTPSVTPEPSPSPSATPSASPTPSPTTPAPSTEPSPTPKPTPSATKGPSPTPPAKLAVTGASGSVVAEAVALLTLGGIALRARRQAACSED